MPQVETPVELAECLANMLGIYGAGSEDGEHGDDCKCRCCFVSDMTERIRESVKNETLLERRFG